VKLIEHFDAFLKDTVNLNQTRIDLLEERVTAIREFLYRTEYGPIFQRFSSQGSWAHQTIIRPIDAKEFDADLVAYAIPVEGWSPRDYVLRLRQVFRDSERYRDKASMKTRCVTINYAGDFHLDVVPIVVEAGPTYQVCNRADDKFELTDGDGYADWWRGRDALTRGHLRRVTRLLPPGRERNVLSEIRVADDAYRRANFRARCAIPWTLLGRADRPYDGHGPSG
jgi:hypothetical protein